MGNEGFSDFLFSENFRCEQSSDRTILPDQIISLFFSLFFLNLHFYLFMSFYVTRFTIMLGAELSLVGFFVHYISTDIVSEITLCG